MPAKVLQTHQPLKSRKMCKAILYYVALDDLCAHWIINLSSHRIRSKIEQVLYEARGQSKNACIFFRVNNLFYGKNNTISVCISKVQLWAPLAVHQYFFFPFPIVIHLVAGLKTLSQRLHPRARFSVKCDQGMPFSPLNYEWECCMHLLSFLHTPIFPSSSILPTGSHRNLIYHAD